MRLACYNVEWFDRLFDDDGTLMSDTRWSGRRDVTRAQQVSALGHVFNAIDADAIMVIEAPDDHDKRSGTKALENFAKAFDLRACRALLGFTNTTQQEITLLYDPEKLSARHDPIGEAGDAAPRFDTSFEIDLDIDNRADSVSFSKPPLELAIETAAGTQLRMIGAHLKSKAPHGAHGRDEIMRFSIANRRKQLAQAVWLRARIDAHLAAGESLILMGDLNDGPGLDEYENLFGRSSVEIILGEAGCPCLYDPHAARALERKIGAFPTTARFFLGHENRYLQALLDYIMISDNLRSKAMAWRIWHPFDDPDCWSDVALRDALLAASDHFPVTLDIDI
ncbi:MAG: endonuclease/exonuclease/phosphatase family protein [Planktotalea sp.]|uniref:endonuclease/exonuclease/phosphatase family protein n=1 Tax=Planktotalea sp. TaxID=2029877 RepID=UPI003C7120A7